MQDEERTFYVEERGQDIIGDSLTYAEAVETLNEVCDEWEADGYDVDRSWASSGNYMAAKGTKPLNADRFISIERDDEDGEES